MTSLYLLGGRQRSDAALLREWHAFEAAVIVQVDLESRSVVRTLEYQSPSESCPGERPSFVFKAGTLRGDRLFTCTQTEVLIYQLPDLELLSRVSLPCFNDLHHVRPTARGTLLVAVTGLDMVVEISPEGTILREWSVLGGDPWKRFSRNTDYRRVPTTKPHASHPNFVFELEGEVWVTRFEQRDAVSLTGERQHMEIGVERPHDGVLSGEWIYFTTVDGHVVRVGTDHRRFRESIELSARDGRQRALGWCRGIRPISRGETLVGFSRIRPTRFRANLRWLRQQVRSMGRPESLPTRIASYDLTSRTLLWELPTEEAGLDAIFSIHATQAPGEETGG